MSGLLCLKWNNHSPAFLKHLSKLRMKELFCDATIVCHNKFFSVHKFVLSTCSEYFEEIFEKTQCKHPFIIVKDIKSSELEALLDYMYEGEVNVLQDLLPGLIKAAECLKVKGLAVPDEEIEDTPQLSSRKSKRDRRNANRSPVPRKRSRHIEDSNLDSAECLQIHESGNLHSKEEGGKVYSNYCEAGIQNEDSISKFNSDLNRFIETNIKLEPDDNNEVMRETKAVETANEYSFNQNDSNSEDRLPHSKSTPSQNFGELGACETNTLEEPQCSNWEGLIHTEEAGDSKTSLEGFQDEIDTTNQPHTSYTQNINPLLNLACKGLSMSPIHNLKATAEGFRKRKKVSYQCPYCPYTSRNSANVKRHVMNKHTGDKPFKCDLCNYRSSQNDHVKKHMRIHTGEKPFECPICPFKAAQSSNIKRHIRTHLNLAKVQKNPQISIENDNLTSNLQPTS